MSYERIKTTDEGIDIHIVSPGVELEEIVINAYSSKLTVYIPETDFFIERKYVKSFSEMLDVPNTTAELNNGILILSIPYHSAAKPKKINIDNKKLK